MQENGKIRILLAERHNVMREGLHLLFNSCSGIQIAGELGDTDLLEEFIDKLTPDIVTVGINIDSKPVFENISALPGLFPEVKIIAHSVYLERDFICMLLRSGISAYVHKKQNFSELLKAVNLVVQNEKYLCPASSDVLMKDYINASSSFDNISLTLLTARERNILKMLSEGCSSKKIALNLNISSKTVDTHRRQIMNKLNIFSVPELTKYAIRTGLTTIN